MLWSSQGRFISWRGPPYPSCPLVIICPRPPPPYLQVSTHMHIRLLVDFKVVYIRVGCSLRTGKKMVERKKVSVQLGKKLQVNAMACSNQPTCLCFGCSKALATTKQKRLQQDCAEVCARCHGSQVLGTLGTLQAMTGTCSSYSWPNISELLVYSRCWMNTCLDRNV